MSTPLAEEDRAFLNAIQSNPSELTAWHAYTDWLMARDYNDPRVEFLRLELRRGQLGDNDPEMAEVRSRLQELRPDLDPNWVAVFDRPFIENCPPEFNFRCPRFWVALQGTDSACERLCGTCQRTVHYCHDIETAREHVQHGEAVAVSLGIARSLDDLGIFGLDDAIAEDLFTQPGLRFDKTDKG